MKQFYKIDNNGYYIEPVISENEQIPNDCIDVIPPQGLYKAIWNGSSWDEGLTQEEIDAIKNAPKELTALEKLKKQQTDLAFELMLKGVL